MRVVIIGSGNVASILGAKLLNAFHIIVQVYSRDEAHARLLADQLFAETTNDPGEIKKDADIYIAAISDSALPDMYKWLALSDRLVVHTAGSVPMDVLKSVSTNYGVLYPLQTLRKEATTEPVIPILVDGNDAWNKTKIAAFAQSFADTVGFANDEERSKLHLAAVITNNFSNHLFALAEDYCRKEGVDFKILIPLIAETVTRLQSASPADMQTGPAARNDIPTIERHLQMLNNYPGLKKLYEEMSESIGNGER